MLRGGEAGQGITQTIDDPANRCHFSRSHVVQPQSADDGADADKKNINRERKRNLRERPVLCVNQRFDEYTLQASAQLPANLHGGRRLL